MPTATISGGRGCTASVGGSGGLITLTMISGLLVTDCWKAWAAALAVSAASCGVAARPVMRRMPVPPTVDVSIVAGQPAPEDLLRARPVDAGLRRLRVRAQQRAEVLRADESARRIDLRRQRERGGGLVARRGDERERRAEGDGQHDHGQHAEAPLLQDREELVELHYLRGMVRARSTYARS